MPLARMHWAYLSAACCSCVWVGGKAEPTALLEVFVLPAALLGVVVAMFATDGDFEPPQPVSTIADAAARSASPPDRRHVVALSCLAALFERSALPFICSVSKGSKRR